MLRLFVGNFDFELSLWNARRERNATSLRRILAELAPAWIAAAETGDVLWCPEPIGAEFWQGLERHGLPRVRAASSLGDVPNGLELVPWGWTDEVIGFGQRVDASVDAPPLDAVRAVNSRRLSHQLERERGVALPHAAMVTSLPELFAAIDRLPPRDAGWVVKAEFSNSSRERFLHRPGAALDRDALASWARRRLPSGQALFVEPWVERLDEVGVQITVPKRGRPHVDGVTRLLVDDAGRYRGSEFTPTLDHDSQWQDAVAAALDAAQAIQRRGYFGPLGIDAMRYRDAAGDIRLRPLQDINARWTMGRLSLGLRRLLRPNQRGLWLHGPQHGRLSTHEANPSARSREIVTSPVSIGGAPVRVRSIIRIIDPY